MTGLVVGRNGAVVFTLRVAMAVLVIAGLSACKTPAVQREEAGLPTPGRIAALRFPGPPVRVIMISVAGLETANFLSADGFVAAEGDAVRMPRLARLAREGVIGEHAIPPSPGSSYASNASLVTGRSPARHGIVGDTMLDDESNGSTPFWESQMLKGDAIWDAAIGRGVMALGWPTTIGARIELLLPDAEPTERNQTWLDLMRAISSPALVRELELIEQAALADSKSQPGPKREPITWPTPAERDAAIMEVACHVALSDRDPGLWLIRLKQTEDALKKTGVGSVDVARGLRRIDDEIGLLADCLDEVGQLADTAIFVTGDVAYRPVHTLVDPNVALVQKGLMGRDPRASMGVRSWLAISRSHGRSAYVYAKDEANAVAAREILEEEARKSGAFRIVPASDLAKADVDPQAWFGLEATTGFEIGNGLTKPMLRPATSRASAGGLHLGDDATGSVGFVAWGRGIRGQVRVPRLELVDIAPTIASLLGLRLDGPIDGTPLYGILRASVPPPPPGPTRLGIGADGDADRALRDLGGGR